ncbi:hypothetical protein PR048_010900 [Dryococelus australis]|uniref:Uncharacterized protein n=1 Tax=Dryococelus australis TaxID=614101 RepID=A0ABQ9I570_9NEOP|nr:hypothetical protein PR048_010900 [Dryococelus australis]
MSSMWVSSLSLVFCPEAGFQCRRDCFSKISEEQMQIFQRLYDIDTKNEQDIFVSSLIVPQEIKRWPRKESSLNKPKKFVYGYFISRSGVCKKDFVSLFGDVSMKRLRCLQSYILQDKTPKDMIGIGNINRALPNKDVLLLNEHISSFLVSVTHYSSCQYRFLPSEVNCHKMYCEELMVRLKSPSLAKRVAEAELQIHKHRRKNYFQ